GGTSALNLKALPPQVREVVMTVYGDATAHIFLISAAVGIVGVLAALALKPIRLRTTLDLKPQTAVEDADSVPTSARLDQETSPGSWVTGALSLSTHPDLGCGGLWRSLVSALDWESRGRRFNSCQPDRATRPAEPTESRLTAPCACSGRRKPALATRPRAGDHPGASAGAPACEFAEAICSNAHVR